MVDFSLDWFILFYTEYQKFGVIQWLVYTLLRFRVYYCVSLTWIFAARLLRDFGTRKRCSFEIILGFLGLVGSVLVLEEVLWRNGIEVGKEGFSSLKNKIEW